MKENDLKESLEELDFGEIEAEGIRLFGQSYNFKVKVTPNPDVDGWDLTREQCDLINAGNVEAIDKFFFTNIKRLFFLARYKLKRQGFAPQRVPDKRCMSATIVEVNDCLNQLYLDMRQRYLYFEYKPSVITHLICHSFYYAGVGGFGDEDGRYKYSDSHRRGVSLPTSERFKIIIGKGD